MFVPAVKESPRGSRDQQPHNTTGRRETWALPIIFEFESFKRRKGRLKALAFAKASAGKPGLSAVAEAAADTR